MNYKYFIYAIFIILLFLVNCTIQTKDGIENLDASSDDILSERTIILEGIGIKEIKINDSVSKIEQLFGKCPSLINYDNDTTTMWNYRNTLYIDFLSLNSTGLIIEFRFNIGFKGKTENNIRIGSTLSEVLSVDNGINGTFIISSGDFWSHGTDKILLLISNDKVNIESYLFFNSKKGILYWFDKYQKVSQIVVYKPY